jgi:hypothetical protein
LDVFGMLMIVSQVKVDIPSSAKFEIEEPNIITVDNGTATCGVKLPRRINMET